MADDLALTHAVTDDVLEQLRPAFENTILTGLVTEGGLPIETAQDLLVRDPDGVYDEPFVAGAWAGYQIGLIHGGAAKGFEVKE